MGINGIKENQGWYGIGIVVIFANNVGIDVIGIILNTIERWLTTSYPEY